jgi:hypothetical protein
MVCEVPAACFNSRGSRVAPYPIGGRRQLELTYPSRKTAPETLVDILTPRAGDAEIAPAGDRNNPGSISIQQRADIQHAPNPSFVVRVAATLLVFCSAQIGRLRKRRRQQHGNNVPFQLPAAKITSPSSSGVRVRC